MRKYAAAAGLLGPVLFAVVLATLSVLQYPFMRSLGWDPVTHPTFDWPSGLALGPIGWIMTATFLVCGALMSVFAWGLREQLMNRNGQVGTILLTWAGVAMMGLAFTTDRVITPLPISWHGRLHDLSFLALGLMIIPAMVMLALSFREADGWKGLSPFTWLICALAIPTFTIKGIVFYAFLLGILTWNLSVAVRLYRKTS
jgi:uncharacterized protein DUF998